MATDADSLTPGPGRAIHRKRRPPHRRPSVILVVLIVLIVLVALGFGVHALVGGSSAGPSATTTTTTTITTTTAPFQATTTQPSTASSSSLAPTTTTLAPTPTVAAASPHDVLVEVINGTGAPNLATTTAESLRGLGFHINGTGDATSLSNIVSLIRYAPGNEAYAQAVAQAITGATQLVADPDVHLSYEVVLIVGSAFQGVRSST